MQRPPLMITAAQIRAVRALLGVDQQTFADMVDVSLHIIRFLESHEDNVRLTETLKKIVEALERAGIELIGQGMPSCGFRRGVRLRPPPPIH
jgi:predicted transcriptional regulator